MQDLRIVLIIIGAIAIGALLVHGYLTNRRNNPKPIKDRPFRKVGAEPGLDKRPADEQGFDQDGIGEVRILKTGVDKERVEPGLGESWSEPQPISSITEAEPDPALGPAAASLSEPDDAPAAASQPESARAAKQEAAQHIAYDDRQSSAPAASPSTPSETESESQEPAAPEDVFVLNVVGGERQLAGAELLPVLLTLGFKYGEMNIFHRHEDSAGNGKVLFSLANMVKPGIFDLDTMEQFHTPGVSLFMTLPCAGEPMANFNLMLQAAQRLADELDGQLLDGRREPLNRQTVQHYRERIQAFERKFGS